MHYIMFKLPVCPHPSLFRPALVPMALSHLGRPDRPTHGMHVGQCLACSNPKCWLCVIKNVQNVRLLLSRFVVAAGGVAGWY